MTQKQSGGRRNLMVQSAALRAVNLLIYVLNESDDPDVVAACKHAVDLLCVKMSLPIRRTPDDQMPTTATVE